jgi:hypothetical protein
VKLYIRILQASPSRAQTDTSIVVLYILTLWFIYDAVSRSDYVALENSAIEMTVPEFFRRDWG